MQTTPSTNGHDRAAKPARKATLKHREIGVVVRLLAEHGAMQGDIYAYHDGWTDERVRDIVSTSAKVEKIAEVRRNSFGKLASEIKAKAPKGKARITELEARIEDLSRRLEALEKAFA